MAQGGIISVLNDLGADCDRDDYEAWYQRDHLPDRLSVPGFRHARRYRRIAGEAQEYFTFYETDSPDVLRSPAYQRRLAEPTEWTTRMMPHFRAMNRTVCSVAADDGAGIGGIVALVGAAAPVAKGLARIERAGVTRARLWRAAQDMPANPEAALRPGGDASFAAILLVEGTTEAAVRAAAEDTAASLGLPGRATTYALIYASAQ